MAWPTMSIESPIISTLIFILAVFLPSLSSAKIINTDTFWQGEISLTEDILVVPGATLTIRPGTHISVALAETTKSDPEYLSTQTEITVRGKLKVEGSLDYPVTFSSAVKKVDGWAGIIVDGGDVVISGCQLRNADTGIYVLEGSVEIGSSSFQDNHHAVVAQGQKASVSISKTLISNNDYGVVSFDNALIANNETVIAGNRKKNFYSATLGSSPSRPENVQLETKVAAKRYYNDVLMGDIIWENRIVIDGLVRIPEGSRLIVMPGTIVEFKKKDSNSDGIGENGLLVQGVLIAKGNAKQPIIFRSAEKNRQKGDWDSINIMNSDGAQNLLEYCRIEDAYRGLHFHFSNVGMHRSEIFNNYRGIQFQESAVELTSNIIHDNKSGISARDSQVNFNDNLLQGNFQGANFFRCNLEAGHNELLQNWHVGLRIREGASTVEANQINGSRFGVMVSDSELISMYKNCITNNGEAGITLKSVDNGQFEGNLIDRNGINGLSLQDTRAVIRNNQIADNGERGIGIISFDGIITRNNFSRNGQYAIGLDGEWDVDAPLNWWGTKDIDNVIFDKHNNHLKGTVRHLTPSPTPITLNVPLCMSRPNRR